MPVYEYRCNSCNIQFELRQKFSDPPADRCPKCGGTVRKLVSAVSFSLKGAGWFGDGYGTKAEYTDSGGDTTAGAATEVVSTDATPSETTVSPATQSSAPNQIETKSTVAEKPTITKDKAEEKS
ncbi:zinc ribbon domain-containing protein [Oryzomonas sp.]|uniref:FmdB family zinc ribbon protein n=1 Tax=Oryzomonas sp. TaxID=2855186 RepID=UPI0028524F3A|nr:zinc ribbon domain-containing protein [Oryzomonas sp.]